MTDDVLQEVRAAREAFAQAHGYDAFAMVAALRRLNESDGRPTVRLPPRKPANAGAGGVSNLPVAPAVVSDVGAS